MAIAPIDLQTLFSQVDKAGRFHNAQREGQAVAQSIQGVEIERKADEQVKQVNEAQNTGEGPDKINDNDHRQNSGGAGSDKRKSGEKEKEPQEDNRAVLSDPSLGRKIDISL